MIESGTSEEAPGQLLQLTRVIIPAGESIAPHTHPGPQLVVVVSGTVTYTVFDGEVELTRDAGTEDAETETVAAGETVELRPGDSLAEPPGVPHAGKNDTDDPVVIYTSSLFPEDEPSSSPAD